MKEYLHDIDINFFEQKLCFKGNIYLPYREKSPLVWLRDKEVYTTKSFFVT